MAGRLVTTDAGRLAALRRRIERWRRTRRGFAWMPEELWADAVALARVEGAYAIARDLALPELPASEPHHHRLHAVACSASGDGTQAPP